MKADKAGDMETGKQISNINQQIKQTPDFGLESGIVAPTPAQQKMLEDKSAAQREGWSMLEAPLPPVPTGNPKADAAAQRVYQGELDAYAATAESRRKAAQSSAYDAEARKAALRSATEAEVPAEFGTEELPQPSIFGEQPTYTTPEDALIKGDFEAYQRMGDAVSQPVYDFTKVGDDKWEYFLESGDNAYTKLSNDLMKLGAMSLGLSQQE